MKSSPLHSTTPFIITGLLFSMLWASASVAGKIGIQSVEPLLLFNVRFLLAGTIMLVYAYLFARKKLPKRGDWKQLVIFGSLNTTLYLGLYIIALKQVSAGIGSLAPATNPLMISVLTAVWTGRRVKAVQWLSIALGMAGVIIATYPLLQNSTATVQGLILMLLSMLCYSAGVIYFAETKWQLPSIVINGWQVFIGGILLLPFSLLMHHPNTINYFDSKFWGAEGWLVIPVSIISVQLWLYLLKVDAVRASLWLFLCPVFGFVYAAILLNEPITVYTVVGTLFVIIGLYLGQKKRPVNKME
ncbi:EamA family transporter [Ilyomonas limi]|uniref:EamA family transporter n=1 Tax=Ilyomonas limi TaxID=2575867 RepID=A0A4U3KYL3_9BACT|nr:EamA family transporter [Ilyomonas limi]TKK67472.1 EamA family transporter [Ilyomonas limi]